MSESTFNYYHMIIDLLKRRGRIVVTVNEKTEKSFNELCTRLKKGRHQFKIIRRGKLVSIKLTGGRYEHSKKS